MSAVAGILLKCVTRNDQYAFFKKEDMAVGPQLMLTSALTFATVTTDRARSAVIMNDKIAAALKADQIDRSLVGSLQTSTSAVVGQIMAAGWTLMLIVVMLWGVTAFVKRVGWKNESELHRTYGIGIPLALGVGTLMFVTAMVSA
jgi:hypothetical protein